MRVLGAWLEKQEREEAQTAYLAQTLWLCCTRLGALAGGGDNPMPEYFALFPPRQEKQTARGVKSRVLQLLKREAPERHDRREAS